MALDMTPRSVTLAVRSRLPITRWWQQCQLKCAFHHFTDSLLLHASGKPFTRPSARSVGSTITEREVVAGTNLVRTIFYVA
jgi:hypothetical protein